MTAQTSSPTTITQRRWPARLKRAGYRICRLIVILYLVVCLLFLAFQTKLIFPGAATQGSPEAVVTPPPGTELLKLKTQSGATIAALFGKASPAGPLAKESAPTLIYFYGNAMCLKDALQEFQQFRRLGCNVIAVEFEGFGMSTGTAGEQGCYNAAEAAYQYVLTRSDIDLHKIVPTGWSLGAAVAIDLAARHAGEGRIAAVMTFSAFTSIGDVGRFHYPGVPVSMILKHKFLSEEKMAKLGVPILIGHGRRDDIIPFPMCDRLTKAAENAGLKVSRLVLDKAAHNDFFYEGESQIDEAVERFLKNLPPAK
jgi:pimeloyl-ACP methyl ester carboxylesterase